MSRVFITVFLCAVAMFPGGVGAATEIRVESNPASGGVGDFVTVHLLFSSDESVNAVEGVLVFDPEFFEVREVRDADTTMGVWIERPHLLYPGAIAFAGVTPGGLTGPQNSIFSVVFESITQGDSVFSLRDVTVLKHDGLGTPVSNISYKIARVRMLKSSHVQDTVPTQKDILPPEGFTPLVAHDESVFGGRWFVSFMTHDKQSSVAYYQVREYRMPFLALFSQWVTTESPYPLFDQERKSTIQVRAIDTYRNEYVAELRPENALDWWEYWPLVTVVLVVGYLVYRILSLLRRLRA